MPKQKTYTIKNIQKNNFSLVLSGGASFGLAHIGIIKFLEEESLRPSEIIGTSMGAVIGALYAIGNTSETIEEKLKNLKTENLFKIEYLRGQIEYDKAKILLKKMFHDKKISETKIPLKIIATNIKDGSEKTFSSKDNISIYDAILASIAIPGVLNAKKIKKEIFIDGCVSSNLPIEVAKKENIKLAINVINRKNGDYHYPRPKRGLLNNLITKFNILRNVSRYYIENQTETKIPTISKLILIEPDLKGFNSYKIINYKKIAKKGYIEIKKYFEESEKKKKEKHKKKKTSSLEKAIAFPLKRAKKILKKVPKLE